MSSINIDKKEFRKIDFRLRNHISQIIMATYPDFENKLIEFIEFIESTELIKKFIDENNTIIYNIESILSERDTYSREIYNVGITTKEKVSFIYQLLKYGLSDKDNGGITNIYYFYRGGSGYNEWLKAFNNDVTKALINEIRLYMEDIRIDIGDDGIVKIEVSGDKSQVNIAKDNASIHAVQDNKVIKSEDVENIEVLMENFLNELKQNQNIPEDLKDEIEDSLDIAKEQVGVEAPKKGRIKSAIISLQSVLTLATLSGEILTIGQSLAQGLQDLIN